MSNSIDFYKGMFLHVSCSYYSSMLVDMEGDIKAILTIEERGQKF